MKRLSLNEIKQIELKILIKYDEFCRKHNLKYVLAYGTLLGAARHKGFIPWDDDIDVMMPRSDYTRFIRLLTDEEKIDGLDLMTRKNTGYHYPFAKLCDSMTVAKMEDNCTQHGVWIDVFPIDKVPFPERKARHFHRRFIIMRALVVAYTTDYRSVKLNFKSVLKKILSVFVKLYGIERLVDHIESKTVKYNDTNSEFASSLCWQKLDGGNMEYYNFINPVLIEFENCFFFAPREYDLYLRSLYGDYMKLPPTDERKTHFIKAYYK